MTAQSTESTKTNSKIESIIKAAVILLLVVINIYLYATKAIPGAIASSIDLRYARATDFTNHIWAGIEEFPSMLICILPLALFPTIETARIGWLVANFFFLVITMRGLRKTFFKDCEIKTFAIWMLLLSSSVPVIIAFIYAQNLLFSMWWLKVSLATIIISPITSSVATNTGVGFLDLMTLLNGGLFASEFLKSHHGREIYYVVFLIILIFILYTAFRPRKKSTDNQSALLLFSMYCALSVVAIYHRQYDYWGLIVPIYYCVNRIAGKEEFGKNEVGLPEKLILLVSVVGTEFIMHGNWIMKLFGVSIEYGIGQKVFYGVCVVGLYLMNAYFITRER